MKPITFPDTHGWEFYVDEVSVNVFQVKGKNTQNKTVEITGTDPETLIKKCREIAKEMIEQS